MTTWGGWSYAGGNGMRLGLDVSWSSPSHGSGSVTATIKVSIQTQYNYSGDSQNLNFSGDISGGHAIVLNSSSNQIQVVYTFTYTYNYPSGSYGSSPDTITFGVSDSGSYNGSSPSVTVNSAVPARPYAAPAAPSGVTATRNSDSQATITWTRNSTSGAPYSSMTLQMRHQVNPSTWSAWTTIASPTGSSTSQVVKGLVTNNLYQFQIRANNSVGSSGYVGASSSVYMTPAAPTAVTAGVAGSGSAITLNWTNHTYADSGITIEIQRSVAGGAFANVVTGLPYTTTTWTDSSPGAGTNQYQVRAVRTSPQALQSAYAQSNTVSTIATPLAPTALAPAGTSVDFNSPVTLTWQHNQGGDGAPITHFAMQYSTDGGTTWNTMPGTAVAAANGGGTAASTASFTVPAGTFTNGTSILWRVQDQGNTAATTGSPASWSPWSASATITGDSIPVAVITSPTAVTIAGPLTMTWTYSQDQGLPQASWIANLFDSSGNLLEFQSGLGTGNSVTFAYGVQNGATYTVEIQVASSSGQYSNWASATTTVNFAPPAPVTCTPTYFPCSGTMQLEIIATPAASGGYVAVDHISIQRRITGNEGVGDWVTIANDIDMTTVQDLFFIDPLPITNGLNEYQIVAVSNTPSYAIYGPFEAPTSDGDTPGDGVWAFMNYGPNFTTLLRYHGDPTISVKTSRNRVAQPILGQELPIILEGTNVTNVLTMTGSLFYEDLCNDPPPPDDCTFDSSIFDWEVAGKEAGLVCFRDYRGRRYFGMIGDVTTSDGLANAETSSSYLPSRRNLASLQWGMTEVYFDEDLANTDVLAAEGTD